MTQLAPIHVEGEDWQGVNPADFEIVGDGTTDDSVAFQSFVDYCSAHNVKGTLDVPVNLNDAVIELGSNLDLEFVGNGKLIDGTLRATGTLGSEVNMSADTLKGARVVNVPGAGFAAGDLVYLKSCINCLSVDAGGDQLGADVGNVSYFAEFAIVESSAEVSITVLSPLVFDYLTTPGASSGDRTHSTVALVTPVENVRLRNIVMQDKADSTQEQMLFTLAQNVDVSGSFTYTHNGGVNSYQHCVVFFKCSDCRISHAVVNRPSHYDTSGSAQNSFFTKGGQDCGFSNLLVNGGGQAVDITYYVGTEHASPSINCYVEDSYFYGAREAVTIHPGCYSTSISNCHSYGCGTGFRLRSKNTRLNGFSATGFGVASGVGVLVSEGGYSDGSMITGGTVSDCVLGISIDIGSLSPSPVSGKLLISDIVASHCGTGVYFAAQTETSSVRSVVVENITCISCATNGVKVSSYNNGVTINGFTAIGPFGDSARAGVEWAANVASLSISNCLFSNLGAIYGLRGNSTSAMMTDATTFPGGESEANLAISDIRFVGHTAGNEFSSILRNAAAFRVTLTGIEFGYRIGAAKVRAQTSQTADVQEWQNSTGTKLLGIAVDGKLSGSLSASVKDAVTAANDVATLKTAILGLLA